MILGKAPRARRKAVILAGHLPQQPPVSPPVVNQQNWAESQPNSSAPPSPTGARDISVSLSAHASGSTATHSASNLEVAPMPTLSLPVGEDYGAVVSEDPMVQVGLFGSMRHSPLSDAEIDAIFNSILTLANPTS
jgi:hypothetical protein